MRREKICRRQLRHRLLVDFHGACYYCHEPVAWLRDIPDNAIKHYKRGVIVFWQEGQLYEICEATVDHFHEQKLGGALWDRKNLVLACKECNGNKGQAIDRDEWIPFDLVRHKCAVQCKQGELVVELKFLDGAVIVFPKRLIPGISENAIDFENHCR